jgi:hypothetical protein
MKFDSIFTQAAKTRHQQDLRETEEQWQAFIADVASKRVTDPDEILSKLDEVKRDLPDLQAEVARLRGTRQ